MKKTVSILKRVAKWYLANYPKNYVWSGSTPIQMQ